MPRKRKPANTNPQINCPPLECDLIIDEMGQGKFNALPMFYRMKCLIDLVFAPERTEISNHAEQRNITLAQAKLELLQATEIDRKRHYQRAITMVQDKFNTEFAPAMELLLRKLAEEVATSALARVMQPGSGLRTKARSASKKFRQQDRRRLNLTEPGRPLGSKTRTNHHALRVTLDARKARILESMRSLFANNLNRETKKAVAEDLGIDRKTLNTWLKEGDWSFEALLAEMGSRNRN